LGKKLEFVQVKPQADPSNERETSGFMNEFIGKKKTNRAEREIIVKAKALTATTPICSQECEKQEHGQARVAGGDCWMRWQRELRSSFE
jgi:hypothetical protein